MKYDFTSLMERHGMDAVAVDGLGAIPGMTPDAPDQGFDAIPLWIADMNFLTAPSIPEAIIQRASHPAYGYYFPRPEYYNAIIRWQQERHGVTGLTPENIGYENGVIGGIVSALNVFCCKGDKVLLHSPTYTGFTWGLEANGYDIVHSPLVQDENGVWRMDFQDMEQKIAANVIHKITVDFGNPVDVDCGVQPSDTTLFHQNDPPGHRVYLLYFLGCGHIFSASLHSIRLKVGDGHSRFHAIFYHIGNQGELL